MQLRTVLPLGTALAFALCAGSAAAELTFDELYDPTRLTEIQITLAPADWDAVRSQSRSIATAMAKERHPDSMESPFDYVKGDIVINGQTFKDVGVRKKGFIGSLDRHRPSLKISFDKYVKKRTVGGQEKLTLNNNKQDPSAMSQAIAYQVFRDAGIAAPRMNFAHVTVNGTDLGIYSNVEGVDEAFVARNFKGAPGSLYEGTVTDFVPGWAHKFETKLGRKGDYADVEAVIRALQARDDQLLAELGKVLDLDQFYDFWVVETLLNHWDGYNGNRNNFFVYRPAGSSRFTFVPWGADSIAMKNPFWQFQPPASVYASSLLSRRLYDHPEGRKRYFTTLQAVMDRVWDEQKLLARVDQIEGLIGGHMNSLPTHESSVTKLKGFISGRRAGIQAELEKGEPEWKWPLGEPAYAKKTGTIAGTFDTKWGTLAGSPFAPSAASMELHAKGAAPKFAAVGATAGPSQQGENLGDPALRITGRIDGSLKMTMVNFGITPPAYKTGKLDIDMTQVIGVLLEIDAGGSGFKFLGLLQGSLELTAVGQEKGERVAGSFTGDIITFSGMPE